MPEQNHKIFKILTLNQISSQGLNRFPADDYQIGGDIADPDAILVRSYNMLDSVIPDSVKAIGRAGAGTNNIPVLNMNSRGIPVFNTPGANANAVKELTLAGMFLAARNLMPALQFVENLQGDDATLNKQAEDGKKGKGRCHETAAPGRGSVRGRSSFRPTIRRATTSSRARCRRAGAGGGGIPAPLRSVPPGFCNVPWTGCSRTPTSAAAAPGR